ncbi:MAG: hypothetical protein ACO1PB_09955 [Ramlibacter sp.]
MTDAHGKSAPDTEGGPEFMQPGQRSGEGAGELSRYIRRDERRREGVQPQDATSPEPRGPQDGPPPPDPGASLGP